MSEFKLKAEAAEPVEREKLPSGTMTRLIGAWQGLFIKRFGSKPYVTGRDASALRLMALRNGETQVTAKLPGFISLADGYLAEQGYPLSLLPIYWNRLLTAAPAVKDRVPDADETDAYLRSLRPR